MSTRATSAVRLVLGPILALLLAAAAQAKAPEWTVAVYIATDEESMGKAFDPRTAHIFKVPLPAGVELLVERDTFAENGTLRVIRRPGEPDRVERLPELDSADPGSMASFLAWARANARGAHRLLIVVAHSWGWRGIIQDYSLPGRPGADSMISLRAFAKAVTAAAFKPDVLLFDACVLGNLEPIEELKDTARYLVASQIELPYNGFPPERLFAALSAGMSPRELARRLPELYVSAYGHFGGLSGLEQEYYPAALAAYDTANWDGFVRQFKGLVEALRESGFREKLQQRPEWIAAFADEDHNVDLVEFLSRLPGLVGDAAVRRAARELLRSLGYPREVAARSALTVRLDPEKVRSFELVVESDGLLPEADAFADVKKRWLASHQDLDLPEDLRYELRRIPDQEAYDREFVVQGPVKRPLVLRPWQTGATYVILKTKDHRGRTAVRTWRRPQDWFAATRFPARSLLLGEAHSQGLPFIHGVGLVLYPEMNATMDRSLDPESGLAGPDFYRTMRFNARTGWAGLMLP